MTPFPALTAAIDHLSRGAITQGYAGGPDASQCAEAVAEIETMAALVGAWDASAKAVEFGGGYLAASADRYMACVNSYESAKDGSDETVDDAEAARTEAYCRLQSDIYEFRKRAARVK